MMNSAAQATTDSAPMSDKGDTNSSVVESPHERAYGTFEVSVIEYDSENEQTALKKKPSGRRHEDQRGHHCSEDCCLFVSLLWMPLRWHTYKIALFHLVNFVFAIGVTIWTFWFHLLKFVVSSVGHWSSKCRRLEAASLRTLLEVDSTIFNFIAPVSERVLVYSSSTSFRDESGVYGFYAQLYFGVAKVVCSAIPGVVSAFLFLWSIQNLVSVTVYGKDTAWTPSYMATVEDYDLVVLLAVLGVYGGALLMQISSVISRHITVFFCAEYLLYSTTS